MRSGFLLLLLSVTVFAFTFGIVASVADSSVLDTTKPADFQFLTEEIESKVKEEGSKFVFQTEVNRMMKLIINSLYKTKEIFLRELISNASDALDKIRFLSLTDPEVLKSNPDLKISIYIDKEKNNIILTDTGIGMTKDDLIKNLGTIAKSGTSEFLASMDSNKTADMGLIGQFGVGFYSVFLVAESVTVISKHNSDVQYIWESTSESDFAIYEDPRGNTLGRGTQIIIHIKDDSYDYLDSTKIKDLAKKYSEFINFPIYLWGSSVVSETVNKDSKTIDGDVEDVNEDQDEDKTEETVDKTVFSWERINSNKPIWTRPPKDILDDEYIDFYRIFTKETTDPKMWVHFRAEGEVEFKSLIYIPEKAPKQFLERPAEIANDRIKLYVRRVFITDELIDFLPRYLTFIKGLIDSDDMPLNVSRETLQQHAMLKILKKKIVAKILESFKRMAENEPEKYKEFINEYNVAIKFGILEDRTNTKRLTNLLRVYTSHSDEMTSFSEYVKRMKKGQPQIYYVTGSSLAEVKASPYVEKLITRGYEVVYFVNPIDEYILQQVNEYDGKKFQSAAKAGLKYGDEDEDMESEEKRQTERYEPLSSWILKTLGSTFVSKVVISNRLTKSPCAVVASEFGSSPMLEKMIQAQSGAEQYKSMYLNQAKIFEINPTHPIMESMLAKVDSADAELEDTLKVLYDSSLLRAGYQVRDSSVFATNIERIVRTNLGVDLSSEAVYVNVPAPEADLPGPFKDDSVIDHEEL